MKVQNHKGILFRKMVVILSLAFATYPFEADCWGQIRQVNTETTDSMSTVFSERHSDFRPTNHVIIAFDDSFSSDRFKRTLMYNGYDSFSQFEMWNDNNIVQNGGVSGAIQKLIDDCGLLKEGDYFSIVNFCMGTGNKSFDDFVKASVLQGFYENDGIAAWCPYNTSNALFPKNQNDWQKVVFDEGYNRAIPSEWDLRSQRPYRYSLLMGAKQYTLKLLKTDDLRTNRVYILLVTDHQFNGNDDIYSEINQLNNPNVSKDEYIDYCREVGTYYKFEFVKEEIICKREYEGGKDYKVMLLEVVPCFSTSLNSVIDYPASFGLHRVKGGYKANFDYQGVDLMFHVEQLVMTVKKNGKVVCSSTNGSGDGRFDLELEGVSPGDDITIDMSCWLSMNDPVYNGVLMSPEDERCSRLNVSRKITLTDHASVFGYPLLDGMWWFSHDNSVKAALIWEVIIVLITIAIVCFIAYKLLVLFSAYRPSNKKIKITHL